MASTSFSLLIFFALFTLTSSTQLLYPVETKADEWCGPFKECPQGSQCMRIFDRSEPFSCFLPRFGSTYSFIEQTQKDGRTLQKAHVYEPLPTWLLASASFGILCAAALLIWSGFFVARRFILFVLKLKCPKKESTKDGWPKKEAANLGFNEDGDVDPEIV